MHGRAMLGGIALHGTAVLFVVLAGLCRVHLLQLCWDTCGLVSVCQQCMQDAGLCKAGGGGGGWCHGIERCLQRNAGRWICCDAVTVQQCWRLSVICRCNACCVFVLASADLEG